jgi:hypothetical protein
MGASVERSSSFSTLGELIFQAAPGERNDVTVTATPEGGYAIEDAGAPVAANASGCVADTPHRVRCRAFQRGEIAYVNVFLGDQNDRARCIANVACGLYGGAGNDVLIGGPGPDELDGGPGNDVLEGGGGNDRLYGDATGNAAEPLSPGGGNDILRGGPGDDQLHGGPGNNQLDGGEGNDILEGGGGCNTIAGGPGVDHLVYNLQSGGALRQAPELDVTFDGLANDGPPGGCDNVSSDVERAYSLTGAVLSPFPGSAPVVQPLSDSFGRPLDTRVGARIYRLSALGTAGAQSGLFQGSPFGVLDTGRNDQATELRLTGGEFAACAFAARRARAARSHKRVRRLLVNAHGLFRVDGHSVSLTVQGTAYELIERCDATIVRVTRGVVAVDHGKRTMRVHAGHQLTIRTHP